MRYLIILLLPFLFAACGNGGNKETEPPKDFGVMEFEIHEDLLGTVVIDSSLGIQFRVPAEWAAPPEEMQQQIFDGIDSISTGQHNIEQQPFYIFSDSLNYGMLFVTGISFPDAVTKKESIDMYIAFVRDRFSDEERQEAFYSKDGIRIHQYLIIREDLMTYKLMFPNDDGYLIQFDYTVLRDNLAFAIKAIESSIGTIEFLYKKGIENEKND